MAEEKSWLLESSVLMVSSISCVCAESSTHSRRESHHGQLDTWRKDASTHTHVHTEFLHIVQQFHFQTVVYRRLGMRLG